MLAHCNEELSRHELSMIQHLTRPVDQQRSRLRWCIITNLEIYNSWVRIYVPPRRSGFRAVALIGKHWLRHDERIKAALRNLRKIILWRTKNQFHPHGAAFEYWPRGVWTGEGCSQTQLLFRPHLSSSPLSSWCFQVIFRSTTRRASSPQPNFWTTKLWPATSSGSRPTPWRSSCPTCAYLPKVSKHTQFAVQESGLKRCFR